jgi:hypothetical protein
MAAQYLNVNVHADILALLAAERVNGATSAAVRAT